MENNRSIPSNKNTIHPAFAFSNIKVLIPVTLDIKQDEYSSWVLLFQLHLQAHNLLFLIDSSSPTPDLDAATILQLDALCHQWMFSTMTKDLMLTVLKTGKTAKDLWNHLKRLFQDNKGNRAASLESKFVNLKFIDCNNVDDFCDKLQALSNRLSDLEFPMDEKRLVIHLVNGLPEEYNTVAYFIQQSMPSFDTARSQLRTEEIRREHQSTSNTHASLAAGTPHTSHHLPVAAQRHQQSPFFSTEQSPHSLDRTAPLLPNPTGPLLSHQKPTTGSNISPLLPNLASPFPPYPRWASPWNAAAPVPYPATPYWILPGMLLHLPIADEATITMVEDGVVDAIQQPADHRKPTLFRPRTIYNRIVTFLLSGSDCNKILRLNGRSEWMRIMKGCPDGVGGDFILQLQLGKASYNLLSTENVFLIVAVVCWVFDRGKEVDLIIWNSGFAKCVSKFEYDFCGCMNGSTRYVSQLFDTSLRASNVLWTILILEVPRQNDDFVSLLRRSIPSRVLMPMWLRLLDILQKYQLLDMWREAFVFLQLKCSVLDKMAFYSLGSCILPLDTSMLFNLVLLFHKDPGGFLETCNCSTEVFELVRSCFEPSRVGFSLHYPWPANVILLNSVISDLCYLYPSQYDCSGCILLWSLNIGENDIFLQQVCYEDLLLVRNGPSHAFYKANQAPVRQQSIKVILYACGIIFSTSLYFPACCYQLLEVHSKSGYLRRRARIFVSKLGTQFMLKVIFIRKLMEYLRWKFRLVPSGLCSVRSVDITVHFSVLNCDKKRICRSNMFFKAEVRHQLASTFIILPSWLLAATRGPFSMGNDTGNLNGSCLLFDGGNWFDSIFWPSHSTRWICLHSPSKLKQHLKWLVLVIPVQSCNQATVNGDNLWVIQAGNRQLQICGTQTRRILQVTTNGSEIGLCAAVVNCNLISHTLKNACCCFPCCSQLLGFLLRHKWRSKGVLFFERKVETTSNSTKAVGVVLDAYIELQQYTQANKELMARLGVRVLTGLNGDFFNLEAECLLRAI
ncbi:hypothetical protein C5167_035340 [Papaver somniferum]|uniref:Uncharacterized protein n=1 Tax=Papaver somniferum TaxID=3469 RepID=A0A4Y7KJA2_PAPSO|nr:hypothetical protein C5167_035340 [Papaver somniferum]